MLKAFLVDDERLARRDLRTLLADQPEIEVVGEAGSLAEAMMGIQQTRPGVIFLDIQLHGETGFSLFDQMNVTQHVVFVTAHDEYAMRAFEVNALDYLLKPVSPERLAETLRRLSEENPVGAGEAPILRYDDRLFVRLGGHPKLLSLSKVVCIRASGDYSEVHVDTGKTALVLRSMKEWEEQLPENHFVRIHRSTIVNVNYIERIDTQYNNTSKVYVKHLPEPLVESRRYRSRLKKRFG